MAAASPGGGRVVASLRADRGKKGGAPRAGGEQSGAADKAARSQLAGWTIVDILTPAAAGAQALFSATPAGPVRPQK